MARRARIHYPGDVYTVILRASDGQDILFGESDGIRFSDLQEEGVKRFDVRIPALSLMSSRGDRIGGGFREKFHSERREGEIEEDHFIEDALRRAGEKMNLPVSMEGIMTSVCKRCGLDPAALPEPGTKRNCSEARAVITFPVWHADHRSPTELGT